MTRVLTGIWACYPNFMGIIRIAVLVHSSAHLPIT
jgi:hypothetical protein